MHLPLRQAIDFGTLFVPSGGILFAEIINGVTIFLQNPAL